MNVLRCFGKDQCVLPKLLYKKRMGHSSAPVRLLLTSVTPGQVKFTNLAFSPVLYSTNTAIDLHGLEMSCKKSLTVVCTASSSWAGRFPAVGSIQHGGGYSSFPNIKGWGL